MANRYWVGGTGTWDGTTTTNWSATSGGASGASVPTSADDVFFDGNSGIGTATIPVSTTVSCRSLVCTGYAGTIFGSGSSSSVLQVHGPLLTLVSGMGWNASMTVVVNGSGVTTAVTSAGKGFGHVTIQNSAGLSMQDALSLAASRNLTLTQGTLTTNNFSLACDVFSSSNTNTRTLTLGSSNIAATGAGAAWNCTTTTGLIVTANTATVTLTGAGAVFRGSINWQGLSVVFSGTTSASPFGFDQPGTTTVANCTATPGAIKTASFIVNAGSLTCTGTLTITGNSATNRLLVSSSVVGTARTITAAVVSAANVDFMDITGAGAANWDLSAISGGSGDAGGNSNITFTPPQTNYWYCDTGYWSDVNHWLGASGPVWAIGGTGGNLLGANQSSLETDLTGWSGAFQCTIARSTAWSAAGSASMSMTATVAGYMDAKTDFVAVTAGTTYSAFMTFRAATVSRFVYVILRWYNSSNVQIGADVSGSAVGTTDSTTGNVTAVVTATAPVGAVNVRVVPVVSSAAVGEVHYVDKAGLYTTTLGRVPLPQDNVRFDSNSFVYTGQTVSRDMPRLGKDIDFTGSTNTPTFAAAITHTLYGSIKLLSSMSLTSSGFSTTFSGRGSHTITSGGQPWTGGAFILTPTGTYTLADAFTAASSAFLVVTAGTFASAGFSVSVGSFGSTGTSTRALMLGTSTVSLTGTSTSTIWNTNNTGLTISAASATIILASASSNVRTFQGGSTTYGALVYTVASSPGALYIGWGNTFDTLSVGPGRTLTLAVGTQTVNNWNVWGTAGNVTTVNSDTPGTAANIRKLSGYLASDYVSVQDIVGTSTGAVYYMGSRSTNVSGNTGLTFTDAPQRFWVGGTATWDATVGTKWAVISGGTGGLAVPTTADDVYLDANSGAGTVTATGGGVANAKTLNATGFAGTLSGGTITVSGSVLLVGSMSTNNLSVLMNPSSPATLTSAGKTFATFTASGGTSSVSLSDALSVTATLTHTSGTFTTNNFSVTCGFFSSSNSNTRTLTLGSSSITINGTGAPWNTNAVIGLTVTANTATVTFSSSAGSSFFQTGPVNWNGMSVVFLGNGTVGISNASNPGTSTFANVTRIGTAAKTDGFQIQQNITITGVFTVNGNSATNRVLVSTNTVGTPRTITAAKTSMSNVDFMDIVGAGAAAWGDIPGSEIPAWTAGGTGGNLLTANQASAETDQTGFAINGGATIARATDWSVQGSASMKVTAPAVPVSNDGVQVFGTPVIVGQTYHGQTVVRNGAAVSRDFRIELSWRNSSGTGFQTTTSGTTTIPAGSTATLRITGVAPATAVQCHVKVYWFNAPAAGETFSIDASAFSAITPGGVGDAGGNSGITFTTGQTNYWVGGTGNWSDVNHWASTSGGVGGTGRVPLPQGNARFDANSFSAASQFVTQDMPRAGKDVDWTGVTNNPTLTFGTTTNIFGSFTLPAGVTISGTANTVQFYGRGSHTITLNGQSFPTTVTFPTGLTGTYTLGSAISLTAGALQFSGSTVITAGFTVTAPVVQFFGGSLTAGSSTFNLTATAASSNLWNAAGSGSGVLSLAGATLVVATTSSNTRLISGSINVGTLTYTVGGSGQLQISNSSTWGTINFSGAARTLAFVAGTINVTNWNVFGAPGALVTVRSTSSGNPTTLNKQGGGYVATDYLSIQDISATPANVWHAGSHSVDVSGNSGWLFTDPVLVTGAQSTESDTGNAGTVLLRPSGSQAGESDTGAAGTALLRPSGSEADETDTANTGTTVLRPSGSQAVETDTAVQGQLGLAINIEPSESLDISIELSGYVDAVFPAPTPPVNFVGLLDPTVPPTLTHSDTPNGHLLPGTYRYSYAAWKGSPAQATAPSPSAEITIDGSYLYKHVWQTQDLSGSGTSQPGVPAGLWKQVGTWTPTQSGLVTVPSPVDDGFTNEIDFIIYTADYVQSWGIVDAYGYRSGGSWNLRASSGSVVAGESYVLAVYAYVNPFSAGVGHTVDFTSFIEAIQGFGVPVLSESPQVIGDDTVTLSYPTIPGADGYLVYREEL